MKTAVWSQIMKWEGEPVLALSLRRPDPDHCRMNRYYQRLGLAWQKRWETVVYPRACAALAQAREESRPFEPWSSALDYTVTLEGEGRLSLYIDVIERSGGPRPLTVRTADTWDVKKAALLTLPQVLSTRSHWRKQVLKQVEAQALEQLQGGESLFYEDVAGRAYRHFSPRRFYCTAEGVVVFYPLLTLGSFGEGIPVFQLESAQCIPSHSR